MRLLSFVFSNFMFYVLLIISVLIVGSSMGTQVEDANLFQRGAVIYLTGAIIWGLWKLFKYVYSVFFS